MYFIDYLDDCEKGKHSCLHMIWVIDSYGQSICTTQNPFSIRQERYHLEY